MLDWDPARAGPNGADLRRYNGSSVSTVLYELQEPDCLAMVEYGGFLCFFGVDTAGGRGGIYRTDGTTFDRRVDLPYAYVTSAVVFDNLLFLGLSNGEVWSWDGGGSPKVVGRGVTASGASVNGLAEWDGALWVSSRESTTPRLKRYADGVWSEPVVGSAGDLDVTAGAAAGLAVLGGKLYLAGQKASTSKVYVVDPAVYPTAARMLETALFSAGLGGDDKVWRSATVTHAALASGQGVQLQHRLDDTGSWTTLGTSSGVGATSATFAFAAGVVGKRVALRVVLTATAGATPVVYEVTVRYAPQPATKRQWLFEALFAGSADLPLITLDGTPSPQTGPQIAQVVWAAKAADGPLSYVDLDGASYAVWFVDLVEGISERSQRRGQSTRGKLRLLEA